MQTTYKQQMEAIQKMRKVADEFYPEYSLALNDAYSTIVAMKWQEEIFTATKLFKKDDVIDLLRKFVYDNENMEIFRAKYVNDGDDHMDFMGIDFNENEFEVWISENLK